MRHRLEIPALPTDGERASHRVRGAGVDKTPTPKLNPSCRSWFQEIRCAGYAWSLLFTGIAAGKRYFSQATQRRARNALFLR